MCLQWAVILVLALLVFSLMRQLGALTATPYREKNPDQIFHPFTELPEHKVELLDGKTFRFGGRNAIPTLIVFFAPRCDACKELPAAIRHIASRHSSEELAVLAVLKRTDRANAEEFIREQFFSGVPIALDQDFPEELNPGGAPFAAAIAGGGVVAAHGKPKSLTHLMEMVQAAKTMDPAVPSHSRRKHEWGESAPYWVPEQMGLKEAAV
jgi:hypothetical protein